MSDLYKGYTSLALENVNRTYLIYALAPKIIRARSYLMTNAQGIRLVYKNKCLDSILWKNLFCGIAWCVYAATFYQGGRWLCSYMSIC